jgi:alcohol dehydrogenase class IV
MKEFIFRIPPQIEVGFSHSIQLAVLVKERGLKKILVVVDHTLHKIGLIKPILNGLQEAKVSYTVFDEITHEPTIAEVDQAITKLNVGSTFDGVVGIGGGSTIDVAKLLAVSGSFDGSVKQYVGTNMIEKSGVPMIMIPTTSGTGAEATPNAIVHDVEEECKKGVVSPYLIPDLVILDPGLTLSLPPKPTAETGIDAFTHAIECFICNKATPMSDVVATDAMSLISKYLRRAVENGSADKEARYYMALASLYGGIAITNSGTGAVHALAYPLGGKYHITHGLSNAILLADVMEFNAQAVPGKFVQVAEAMGIDMRGLSQEQAVQKTIAEIRQLVKDVGIMMEGFKVSEQVLDDLAKSALTVQRLLQNNPRPMTYEDARQIYTQAL